MGRVATNWLVAVSVMIGFCASGWAETVDAGKTEFLSSCADCHGPDGKGTGPLASKLKTKPADLTTIAKNNNGVFPLVETYVSIDGRNVTKSHTADDMPIWGCRHTPSPISPTSPKPKVFKPNSPKVFRSWSKRIARSELSQTLERRTIQSVTSSLSLFCRYIAVILGFFNRFSHAIRGGFDARFFQLAAFA